MWKSGKADETFSGNLDKQWFELVEWVKQRPVSDPHAIAWVYMLRKLQQETHQHKSGYSVFCTQCYQKLMADYSGREAHLLQVYQQCLKEIKQEMQILEARKLARRQRKNAA